MPKSIQITYECLNMVPTRGSIFSKFIQFVSSNFMPYSLILADLFSQCISFYNSSRMESPLISLQVFLGQSVTQPDNTKYMDNMEKFYYGSFLAQLVLRTVSVDANSLVLVKKSLPTLKTRITWQLCLYKDFMLYLCSIFWKCQGTQLLFFLPKSA